MRDRQLHIALLAGRYHLVGLRRRAAKRLLHVNVNPALGSRDYHIAMLIEPPRADRHDLRLRFIEHLPVIGIRLRSCDPLGRFSSSLFIRIGDGHNFTAVLELGPDQIVPMAVITAARMTDDADTVLSWHGKDAL